MQPLIDHGNRLFRYHYIPHQQLSIDEIQLRILVHFLVGILIGVLYYDIGNEASKALSNVAFLFFIILFIFASNSIVCIALLIIPAYYLTGQHSDGLRAAQFWLISLISLLIAQTYGVLFGIMFQYPDLGLFMLPATYIPLILFSGFFLQLQDIPYWLKWGAHLSFFRYSFEGSMQCVYGHGRERMNCLDAYCYFKSPLKILEQFNMLEAVYEYDVLVLLIWYISLLIAIFFVLRWRISCSNN
ncbi:ATP-binding cassette sub-family G member 4 [Blattella germanica]|nr:ATP-binding cassette sub-family G member 4 [Blattella germanica]